MATRVVNQPAASYDTAGTTIRISYDPSPGSNVLDDPAIVHEVAHYGQNIATAFGISETMICDELTSATIEILAGADELWIPMSLREPATPSTAWDRAHMALEFLHQAVGSADVAALGAYEDLLPRARSAIVAGALQPGSRNPFWLTLNGPQPAFGLRVDGFAEFRLPLDGYFVLETHAYSSEFIERWVSERLDPGEAVSLFLHGLGTPYKLFFFVVQRFITSVTRRAVYDVVDSVLICHLCSHLALNAYGLSDDAAVGAFREAGTRSHRFRYRDLADLFLRALQACLRQFRAPGQAMEGYFELMQLTLWDLGWPPFRDMMTRIDRELLDPLLTDEQFATMHPFRAHTLRKLCDSRTAIEWCLKAEEQRDVMMFARAPFMLITNADVDGPLLLNPIRRCRLSGHPDAAVTREQLLGLYGAELTRKLWFGGDLTCIDSGGPPHTGSLVRCSKWPSCRTHSVAFGGVRFCDNESWRECLGLFPSLARRLVNHSAGS
jgi:hypothetical protein